MGVIWKRGTAWLVLALVLLWGTAVSAGTIRGTVNGLTPRDRGKVLVYVKEVPGTFAPPAKPAVMDQKGMVFTPFLLPVIRGTTVNFLNSDQVRHNVFSPSGEKYNLGTWPSGEVRSYTFKNLGVYEQLCNVHPEMEAYIVVLQNPYFAPAAPDGAFSIGGVKDGSYTLVTFHPTRKFAEVQVTVSGGGASPVSISSP